MESENPTIVQETPEYYYDLSRRELTAGKVSLQACFEQVNDPPNVLRLGTLLRDRSIDIPFNEHTRTKRTIKQILEYGRWLCEVVDPPILPNEKTLNHDVINRASKLGLGPTAWEIRSHPKLGSLSKFYVELGVTNTKRNGAFKDWSYGDFIEYVRTVSENLGRKPTLADLEQLAHQDTINPSAYMITQRFGSLRAIYEHIGHPNIYSWEEGDYLDWGVKFMLANDGALPSQKVIDTLSKLKKGPSAAGTASHFGGSLTTFQQKVEMEYAERLERKQVEKIEMHDTIAYKLELGLLPPTLFEDLGSEDDMIIRYAKFLVVDDLLHQSKNDSKISISKGLGRSYAELGFVRSIRRVNSAITAGDIESSALYQGVFDYIWPPDTTYMETLKLPEELRAPKRQRHLVIV